jgi:hypothetical protein
MKSIPKIILVTVLFFSWNFNSADLNFKTEIQAETLSDWYDADWNYRKSVNISGSPSVLADFQVLMAIDTAVLMSDGKMSLDCSDLRFTDSDGGECSFYSNFRSNNLYVLRQFFRAICQQRRKNF